MHCWKKIEENGMTNLLQNITMKKIYWKDHSLLWEQAYKEFVSVLSVLDRSQSFIIVGVSWWTSLLWFYKYISVNANQISQSIWKKIIFVFLDERVVGLDDQDSNYKSLYESFFSKLIIEWYIWVDQIIPIDISKNNYLETLNSSIKSIDIALVWVGPDWHVCSLFPNHKWLNSAFDWYIYINNSPKPPSDRITISQTFLKSIDNVFIFFMWESKRNSFENFFLENVLVKDCPAKIVINAPNLNVISDLG